MSLSLPDPLVAKGEAEPELQEDRAHRLSAWGVQRNFEAFANVFPLSPSDGNFGQVPQCRAYHDTTQSVANNATQTVVLNNERWDLGAPTPQHDTVTNNSRLTCVVPGLYSIVGHADFASSATGDRAILVRVNGATVIANQSYEAPDAAIGGPQSISTHWRFVVGDYVELRVYQNSGVALNLGASTGSQAELSFLWVSP